MTQSHRTAPQTAPQFDPEQLSNTALDAFFNLAAHWGLKAKEERVLLGSPPDSTFYKWKSTHTAKLSVDTLQRISYLLGIYKALHILLPTSRAANEWIRKPNGAPLLNGQSALERMLSGSLIDLADVRRYLDAQRGW